VEMITGVLYTNKNNEDIVCWKFKPV
jgi:hypothetical protein